MRPTVFASAQQQELLASDISGPAEALAGLMQHGDQVDGFFERRETVHLLPRSAPDRFRLLREQGLAIRRVGPRGTRLASADSISGPAFAACCDRVAGKGGGSIGRSPPRLRTAGWPPLRLAELERAEVRLTHAVRRRRVGFPMKVSVRRHRRQVLVIRGPMSSPSQFEEYCSLRVEMPWGVLGGLAPSLLDDDLEPIADCLVDRMRSRNMPPHPAVPGVIVLGPHAAAVMLHEVVAHTLEADTLALTGSVDRAVGLKLGGPELDVVDDPRSAPSGSKRSCDDEGSPTVARWLLRRGRVRQPLADLEWADRCHALIPGASRRANRHQLPGPRTTHLELLPGDLPEADLFAEAAGGLYIREFESGSLDPFDGRCVLRAPCARRIGASGPVDYTGPVVIRSRTADLLGAVTAVGDRPLAGGAGWCAKDGALLPVWARCPSLRLEGLAVRG